MVGVRRDTTDLRGQVVLITGASRGLGLLLARELSREGCRVAICAPDEDELERARFDLEGRGAEVLAVVCDVSDRAQVDRLVLETTRHFGQIDILINNAGFIRVGPIDQMAVEDFEDTMGVMFWGMLYATLAVLPQMLARGQGRIANITSIGGVVGIPHLLPYTSAKFAAVGLSEGLRAELGPRGVTVTTVIPGLLRVGSYLHATFKGRQVEEFRWFAVASTMPVISLDGERAARQIVRAVKRGQATRIIPLPASILTRLHGLFPGLTADLLGLLGRLVLPKPAGETTTAPGMALQGRARSPLLDRLTAWGTSAARRFNEYPASGQPNSDEPQEGDRT
jgi:NAD(P)-dependent dehydrogenase (short-subunit alcohol dehydrogenase family)